jgi:hypothetical protein
LKADNSRWQVQQNIRIEITSPPVTIKNLHEKSPSATATSNIKVSAAMIASNQTRESDYLAKHRNIQQQNKSVDTVVVMLIHSGHSTASLANSEYKDPLGIRPNNPK